MTSQSLHASILALGPLLLLAAGCIPLRFASVHPRIHARALACISAIGFALALTCTALLMTQGLLHWRAFPNSALGLDLHFDNLSATLLLLVAFLGAVITRYSINYMDGDARQPYFTRWMAVTLASVQVSIISGNLLEFTLGWVATSLALHQLLTIYPERPRALQAAHKKFLISRLGDVCLIFMLAVVWKCCGTWNYTEIFAAVESGKLSHSCIALCSVLLVGGAMLKSAQFPFHTWLPNTMETPTPVSALMHAGIINAGGFLIVRFSPIIVHAPGALNALAVVGAITALFASVVMLSQTSIKRALAYSTVAQMGFMMLQCGLGEFALAVLHIVAHSLYKAHAFLSSGSVIQASRSAWQPTERPAAHPIVLVLTFCTAILITWLAALLFGRGSVDADGSIRAGMLLLGSVFLMALSYMLWNLWASSHRASLVGHGLFIAAGAASCYFLIHDVFARVLAPCIPHYAPARSPWEYGVMVLIGLLFMAVLTFQSQLPAWSATRVGKSLYVHSQHGFYLGDLADRLAEILKLRFSR